MLEKLVGARHRLGEMADRVVEPAINRLAETEGGKCLIRYRDRLRALPQPQTYHRTLAAMFAMHTFDTVTTELFLRKGFSEPNPFVGDAVNEHRLAAIVAFKALSFGAAWWYGSRTIRVSKSENKYLYAMGAQVGTTVATSPATLNILSLLPPIVTWFQ